MPPNVPPPASRAGLPLAMTFCIAACGGTAPDGTQSFETMEVGWTVVLEVGGTAEHGGVVFSSPLLAVAISPNGTVAVLDPAGSGAYLLNAYGRTAVRIGRRGYGPGEFQIPELIGFLGDTLLWISDRTLNRISYFDSAGNYLSSRSWPRQPIAGSPWSVRLGPVLSTGSLLGRATGNDENAGAAIPVTLWHDEGDVTIVDWIRSAAPRNQRIITARGVPLYIPFFFRGDPIMDVASGGNWFFAVDRSPRGQAQNQIVVRRYDAYGRALSPIHVPHVPIPVSDSLKDEVRLGIEKYLAHLPSNLGPVDVQAVHAAVWIPAYQPVVQRAFGDDGGIWLWRNQGNRPRFERFDTAGVPQYELVLPPRNFPVAAARRLVAVIEIDGNDIPIVRLLRLTSG